MKDNSASPTPEALKFPPHVLRAAYMADLLRRPITDEAKALVSRLMEESLEHELAIGHRKRKIRSTAREGYKNTVAALLADLLIAQLNLDSEGFCYRSSNRDSFKSVVAESRAYEALKRSWEELGYIDIAEGFRGTDDFDGASYHPDTPSYRWAARIRGTEKLLCICADYGVTPENAHLYFKRDKKLSRPIRVRSREDKEIIEMPRTAKLEALEAEVNEINAFLSEQTFSFGPAPNLYRAFNYGDAPDFDWNYGGRFYCQGDGCYLNQPKEGRPKITINRSPVVQIDVTACQLTMLHGLLGFDMNPDEDPYDIPGISREYVKTQVNIAIGKGSMPNHLNLRSSTKAKDQNLAKIIEKHPVLQYMEENGLNSLRLQAIESDIMTATLLELVQAHQIPALPIHDCLLVSIKDADAAETVFKCNFKRIAGIEPRMTRE